MKKIIFSAICFLLISCSDTVTLDMYKCTTDFSAKSCDKSCSSFDMTRTFKVNVDRQQVISNGNLEDNCKVFDKKNWECNWSNSISFTRHVMRDGKYYSILEWIVQGTGTLGKGLYSCGK